MVQPRRDLSTIAFSRRLTRPLEPAGRSTRKEAILGFTVRPILANIGVMSKFHHILDEPKITMRQAWLVDRGGLPLAWHNAIFP